MEVKQETRIDNDNPTNEIYNEIYNIEFNNKQILNKHKHYFFIVDLSEYYV